MCTSECGNRTRHRGIDVGHVGVTPLGFPTEGLPSPSSNDFG